MTPETLVLTRPASDLNPAPEVLDPAQWALWLTQQSTQTRNNQTSAIGREGETADGDALEETGRASEQQQQKTKKIQRSTSLTTAIDPFQKGGP